MSETHSEKQYRTPIFKAFRKVVDAVEEVVDDVVDRGAGAERDVRRLADNLLREKEEEKKKAHARGEAHE